MWRALLLTILLTAPGSAKADLIGSWSLCQGGPAVHDCRPLSGVLDPQGHELWLRAPVRARLPEAGPATLSITGTASSEVWFNGVRVGSNGMPGNSAAAEQPGLYDVDFPLGKELWRLRNNELVLRLSAFHNAIGLAQPVASVRIDDGLMPPPVTMLGVNFAAAGALLAAAFVFGAIFAMRRTGSSLMLAAMAAVAALQAFAENFRYLVPYIYPTHVWRLAVIWLLAAIFAVLLASYASARFAPHRRRLMTGLTVLTVCASCLVPGFDLKTGAALAAGIVFAAIGAGLGIRQGRPGARLMLIYLTACTSIGLAAPAWFLDMSFFILAAILTIPLLVADVVRLGLADRGREAALTQAISRPDRLTVATTDSVELVPLHNIVAILGADDYAELRLLGGRRLLHDARLERLEAQLPKNFMRVHRSVIANLAHILRLDREGTRWKVQMTDGASLPVSKARLGPLREVISAK